LVFLILQIVFSVTWPCLFVHGIKSQPNDRCKFPDNPEATPSSSLTSKLLFDIYLCCCCRLLFIVGVSATVIGKPHWGGANRKIAWVASAPRRGMWASHMRCNCVPAIHLMTAAGRQIREFQGKLLTFFCTRRLLGECESKYT